VILGFIAVCILALGLACVFALAWNHEPARERIIPEAEPLNRRTRLAIIVSWIAIGVIWVYLNYPEFFHIR
jgi:hypothetical protein